MILVDIQTYLDGQPKNHISNQDWKGVYNWLRHTKQRLKETGKEINKADCQIYHTVICTNANLQGSRIEALPLVDIETDSLEKVREFLEKTQEDIKNGVYAK